VNGRLLGDNTDGRGFYEPLREQGVSVAGQRVVVLGAGGAARSVVFQLAREGAKVILTNRTPERAERLALEVREAGFPADTVRTLAPDDLDGFAVALRDASLLVQTTRVGMHPDIEALPPVPLAAFHPDLLVYDLVYNPVQTRLLQEAEARGCKTLTGIKMLVYQGAVAFQRWTGQWPPTEVMEKAVLEGMKEKGKGKREQ
jgi:shikimate dehydrogenase